MRSFSPLYSSFDISRWAAHALLPRASEAATIPIPKSLTMGSSVGDDMIFGMRRAGEVPSAFPLGGVRVVLQGLRSVGLARRCAHHAVAADALRAVERGVHALHQRRHRVAEL